MTDPTTTDPTALSDDVVAIAVEAGAKILVVYGQDDFDVALKEDDSPLTRADLASHRHIVARLEALTPDIPVLSEEAAGVPFDERREWGRFWLVDPLDGTKEFVKRNGEFTVNIALIEDGVPVLGVVHAPVLDTTYLGVRGAGAAKIVAGGRRTPIATRPPEGGALRLVSSRSHANEATGRFIDRVAGDYRVEQVSKGSSLKICLVAEGDAQVYPRLGPTMEWDTAAAQCVAEQAGGSLVGLEGEPLRYNKQNLLNPFFLVTHGPAAPWLDYLDSAGDEAGAAATKPARA